MIGAIADDFTGGTDVAVAFRRAGLRTAIVFGAPDADGVDTSDLDAVVVALKTRTIDADSAVDQSLRAARWLRSRDAGQIYFKYCSTFDSGPSGNIGPVTDALAALTAAHVVAIVPASPEHARTQYLGHLFVNGTLLEKSPMRHHPLTPMTNSLIPDVLAEQTRFPVQLVTHDVVQRGSDAIEAALAAPSGSEVVYCVVDAINDADLTAIGSAVRHAPLVTGAAGLAGGLGRAIAASNPLTTHALLDPVGPNPTVVIAGSCSARTLEQITLYSQHHPAWFMDIRTTSDAARLADDALRFIESCGPDESPLVYSSVSPTELARIQAEVGSEHASRVLEDAAGRVAQKVRARGTRRIIAAGGETSGAITTALTVKSGVIGDEQAPGVPWIYTEDGLALLLKSGNFGDADMLLRAVSDHAPGAER